MRSVNPKILVTGFEPFAGADDNPSARLVERVAALADRDLVAGVLPVSAARLPGCLMQLLDAHRPDAVLGIGEARRCAVVRVECVAVNVLCSETPDNDGVAPSRATIVPDAPPQYPVTMPTGELIASIGRAGVACELSNSAGTYICNQMLYLTLRWASHLARPALVGFLHVPSLPGQSTAGPQCPTMPLDDQFRAVRAALHTLRDAWR